MSWDLIKGIQEATDVRLILPFGLALRLGDVISVDKNGGFTLEGSSETLLGMKTGRPRSAAGQDDIMELSGQDTSVHFRAAGDASALFPELPTAAARFDIGFASAKSWLLAVTGRSLTSLEEVNRFRKPIIDAYRRGVWKPDWALVISIADGKRLTLLASQSANTNVALGVSANVQAAAPVQAQLTAGASVMASSERITQRISKRRSPIGCTALRVRDPWWRSPFVSTLEYDDSARDPLEAPDQEFWEDSDELG